MSQKRDSGFDNIDIRMAILYFTNTTFAFAKNLFAILLFMI